MPEDGIPFNFKINIDDIDIENIDEGGEDQGPCFLTMPRG